ncbi:LysR family transcriptional regulator [Thalassotalea sp. PLHSN55]|uniref:LysR family transcriptional regulator n=1 Tax=Thalassotalea sp. PLHSN55 TaxID=3435888 RepID=UPI003F82BB73
MSLDLNLIKTFLQVHQCGSYTLAAQYLNVSQPAVSGAIKRLEQELDCQLFIKAGRGIRATLQAERLASRFQLAMDEVDNAISDRDNFHGYLMENFIHCIPRDPNIVYQETPADQMHMLQEIKQQKADFAIGVITVKDPALVFEEVFVEPCMVVCRQDHPRIKGTLSEQDFYQEKHILHARKWDNMTGFEYAALTPIQERVIDVTTSSIAGIALHASLSDSLGLLSHSLALKLQDKLALQVLPCPIPIRDISYQLVYHPRYRRDPAHKKMREQLKRYINHINNK